MTDRETATVLAALRYWQDQVGGSFPVPSFTADHFHEHRPLTVEEIDELCERLNCGEA